MCKKEQVIEDLLAENKNLKQENFELKLYRKALHKWDNLQVLMLFEEMAELQKEICKNIRRQHPTVPPYWREEKEMCLMPE